MRFSRLRFPAIIITLDAEDAPCDALHLATVDKLIIDVAKRLAKTVVDSAIAYPLMAMFARRVLAMLSVIEGDSTSAEEQCGYFELWRGSLIIGADVSFVDNFLGLLSRTRSKLDDAQTHFEDALAISSELGMRPLMGRVLSRREILKA